jgi:hypothetical protein
MTPPLRIANCAGFLGDRHSAAREMVDGGPIDVLTGDYLAELTMAILARQRMKDPAAGFARQFLEQLEDVLVPCVDRGIKVVANAGGLNPAGLAAAIAELARKLGVSVTTAWVDGDDLMERLATIGDGWPHAGHGGLLAGRRVQPVAANAYLGGWGIAAALRSGADVVITGRVSDASLAVGPAAWHHGWQGDEWDALAGAVVAGHIIECGTQATGGNYAFFEEVPGPARPGFPIAEIAADGTSVITKHPGTGGMVTTGTVTAQLLYEIGGPSYLNPDVTVDLSSIGLEALEKDRISVTGVVGDAPPPTTKVGIVGVGGHRNSVTFVIPGLDVEAKAEVALEGLWDLVGPAASFGDVEVQLVRTDQDDPPSNEAAMATLKVTVVDADPSRVGRAFSDAAVQLALGSYPGFTLTDPPRSSQPLVVFWPTTIEQALVPSFVTVRGERVEVPAVAGSTPSPAPPGAPVPASKSDGSRWATEETVDAPLGRLLGARSGDKGGDANVGVWARSDAAFDWMLWFLTVDRFRELIPESVGLGVARHTLANLRGVNFVVEGFLGEGVATSNKRDPQAKTLGEYLRARVVPIPEELLAF